MNEREFDIQAGQRSHGFLRPELGHPLDIPYHVLRGHRPGPTLLITAGVHGAEYASIEAANQIAQLDPEGLNGMLLVLPIVNPPSFFARSIYTNPVDGKNLNRVFPGNPQGTFADRLAHWLSDSFIRHADAYLDLHGGDLIEALSPFALYAADHAASRELAEAFGLPYLIASHASGMSYTAGASLGIPSVLAEAGGQGQWPPGDIEQLVEGAKRVMQHLGMLSGETRSRPQTTFETFAWLRAEASGYWYPRVRTGDQVNHDQLLGVVTTLHGETVQEAHSPVSGTALFHVSSLAMNEGDPLVGIGA